MLHCVELYLNVINSNDYNVHVLYMSELYVRLFASSRLHVGNKWVELCENLHVGVKLMVMAEVKVEALDLYYCTARSLRSVPWQNLLGIAEGFFIGWMPFWSSTE